MLKIINLSSPWRIHSQHLTVDVNNVWREREIYLSYLPNLQLLSMLQYYYFVSIVLFIYSAVLKSLGKFYPNPLKYLKIVLTLDYTLYKVGRRRYYLISITVNRYSYITLNHPVYQTSYNHNLYANCLIQPSFLES